jgi:hypothetical protein
MLVLAHRAQTAGVDQSIANSLFATEFCLKQGWGVETDIRRTHDGQFYISHDPGERTSLNHADAFCALFRRYPETTIALNVKELGYEDDLIRYLATQKILHQVFLFDMELLEAMLGETAARFRRLDPRIRLAGRVSDRNESIQRALDIQPVSIIWLDEFDRLWATETDIRRLKLASKQVYAISPELHGFTLADMRQRWEQFYAWGVDGICTDYATELSGRIQVHFREAL